MKTELSQLLSRIADTLDSIDAGLTKAPIPPCDFERYLAFTWQVSTGGYHLQEIPQPRLMKLDDLIGIDAQKATLMCNTEQFLQGKPANHVLLWGAKGTGKSSIIKGLLHHYADQGLRVIEVDRSDLVSITKMVDMLGESDKKFILFCDDLSFESNDISYKALKVALDGGMSPLPENVRIYATSNRRHLIPESIEDNLNTQVTNNEIHYGDAVEEKISLSERFGIWLFFSPLNDDAYLKIVAHWLQQFGYQLNAEISEKALLWARTRASNSGRCAYQFTVDFAGRQ